MTHNHHHHEHVPGRAPSSPRATHAAQEHGGHDKHAGHSVEMFRDRFSLTLALTIPTLI
jgi:Cu2+-exporting ATPase